MVEGDVCYELRWERAFRVEEFGESRTGDFRGQKPCARAGGEPVGLKILQKVELSKVGVRVCGPPFSEAIFEGL